MPETGDQEVYEGKYEQGKYHGAGKTTKGNESFVGDFLFGYRHGKGKYNNTLTGESYEGNYNFGVIHG